MSPATTSMSNSFFLVRSLIVSFIYSKNKRGPRTNARRGIGGDSSHDDCVCYINLEDVDSCKRECSVKVDLLTGDDDYDIGPECTGSSSSVLDDERNKMLSEKQEPHILKPTKIESQQCGGKACGQCEDVVGIGITDW